MRKSFDSSSASSRTLSEMIRSRERFPCSRTGVGLWSRRSAGIGRGFCLFAKRFESGRFVRPGEAETFALSERAFHLLLDGIVLGARGRMRQKWRLSFDAQVSSISHDEIVEPLQTHTALEQTFGNLRQSRDELARQVEWLRRQIFDAKSERRILDEIGSQMAQEKVSRAERAAAPEVEIPTHHRRFDESVPVVVIELGNREITHPESQTLVGEKVTEPLAQQPGSHAVLRVVRKV